MLAPTYDLQPKSSRGSSYLADVSELLDEVLLQGESLRLHVEAYGEFVARTTHIEPPLREELLLDLLMLGVLYRARGTEAMDPCPSRRNLVTELVRERRQGLGKRRDGSQNGLLAFDGHVESCVSSPRISDLVTFTAWLFATGEYDDEVKRLSRVLKFLETQGELAKEALALILALAGDFESRAVRHLGRYTAHVDHFLLEQLAAYAEREDAAQCSRRRIEYHLNMVGAELLNRAWQKNYLACREHVVVLPGCLRARDEAGCRATRTTTELHCTHCTSACMVSRATRMAESCGKSAVAVVHGSDFSQFLKAAVARGRSTGIVGIACAPGLLGAGLRAKELGVPAQCVLLDASGCGHWKPESSPSTFDTRELERILVGAPPPNEALRTVPPSARCSEGLAEVMACGLGG